MDDKVEATPDRLGGGGALHRECRTAELVIFGTFQDAPDEFVLT